MQLTEFSERRLTSRWTRPVVGHVSCTEGSATSGSRAPIRHKAHCGTSPVQNLERLITHDWRESFPTCPYPLCSSIKGLGRGRTPIAEAARSKQPLNLSKPPPRSTPAQRSRVTGWRGLSCMDVASTKLCDTNKATQQSV